MKNSLVRYLRSRLTSDVKTSSISAVAGQGPSIVSASQPASAAVSETAAASVTPLSPVDVASTAIINDNDAQVSAETLLFYLKGIFPDAEALDWIQSRLSRKMIGRTFDDVEKKIEQLLSRERRPPELVARMSALFAAHLEATRGNRRAYIPDGRANPNAVFWPDPTHDRSHPMGGRSLYTELPFAKNVPLIDKTTRIVSAGSCFASEIAHELQKNGYRYLVKEGNKGKPGSYEFLGAKDVLPYSSAAWGIIFNTPSFRQLVEKAFEVRSLPRILWTQEILGKLRYLDPFRENIGFDSPEAYEENYSEHVRAARDAFLEMDVFIITLGLNEIWYFKADGAVFSRSPWRTAPSLVGHRIMTVQENVDDLVRMTEILRAHNPNVSIVCTLSPVALHATFRADEQHIVTANAHSKSVLRVAAEEFVNRTKNAYYFPSYEVVTTSTEAPWKPDQRHVSELAVGNVMKLFHEMYEK